MPTGLFSTVPNAAAPPVRFMHLQPDRPNFGLQDLQVDNPGGSPSLCVASVRSFGAVLECAADHLPDREIAASARFVRQSDRKRHLLGRLLARSLLNQMFGVPAKDCDFDTGAHGKPRLRARSDITFNIGHSGDLVLVGAGTGMALGVDVEQHRSDIELESVSQLVFTIDEAAGVLDAAGKERVSRFFRQWVLKEAVVKALGTGLLLDPRRFSIDASGSAARVRYVGAGPDDVGNGWTITDIDLAEDYSAAVAWRSLRRCDDAALQP